MDMIVPDTRLKLSEHREMSFKIAGVGQTAALALHHWQDQVSAGASWDMVYNGVNG